jgi:phosphoribosylformylglycinamidine synthase
MSIKAGIIVFPGTNCDRDTQRACEFFGWETEFVWHDETSLEKYDVVFLPGGFSYGDYIRAGRLARFSPVVMALTEYVKSQRGFTIGICNGFQILCEAKLLPGILSVNDNTKFICEEVDLSFNGKIINLPIAHGEGRFIADETVLELIKSKNMDFLRYADNPNGSTDDIAGLWDKENNVIGMMPHPERAIFSETGNTDGRAFFEMVQLSLRATAGNTAI